MGFHCFCYTLKALFRSKMLIFWTFAFPIILGTFFNLAFSNIENSEKLETIPIAIIENEDFEKEEVIKEAFYSISQDNQEEALFRVEYTNEESAKELLEKGEIIGYLKIENETPIIHVKKNGTQETILQYVVEEIKQTEEIAKNLMQEEITKELQKGNTNLETEKIRAHIEELLKKDSVELNNTSRSNLSYTMIEYYTLLAMTCLYGGILGVVVITHILPNMTPQGKRVAVSPVKKGKLIVSEVLASYVVQFIGLILLVLYTIVVLKVDYGPRLLPVVGLLLVGCLAGQSLGIAVGSILKVKEDVKTGILISITMLGCFLSGMMGITMQYIVNKNAPIVNKLNPASMITDGFYSLYYYDTLNRYWWDMAGLLIFSCIMLLLSFLVLRRQKYDSI